MNWLEIMSAQSPTSFGCINIDNSPSELDVLCVNAFKAVRALNVFDDSLFEKVPSYEKKHLHTWCVEVLAADFWGFFNPDTNFNKESRPVLIDRFIQLYEIGSFLDADEEFKIDLDYQEYIHHNKRFLHIMGIKADQLVKEYEHMLEQMTNFRQRWQATGIDPLVNPTILSLIHI